MTKNIRILDRQFVPAGTLILEQGTLGTRAFVIESGGIDVFVTDAQGHELILTRLGPGAMVGEMAALGDGVRSASARTSADSVLVTISAYDLQASLRASDNLYKRLMQMMVARMKDTNMKLLKKQQHIEDIEKAAKQNIETMAAHLAGKQETLAKELIPFLMHVEYEPEWEETRPWQEAPD